MGSEMDRVVIIQEYVPRYRVPFFKLLSLRAAQLSINVEIVSGQPNRGQALRLDSCSSFEFRNARSIEFKLFGRRIVFRNIQRLVSDADLVILEQARRNLDAYWLLRPGRGKQPKIALWGHGKDFSKRTNKLDIFLLKWLTLRADWFFAYTHGSQKSLVSTGFNPDKITVVQNSIDVAEISEQMSMVTKKQTKSFKKEHDLRGKTALYIGGLDKTKRIDFLLESAHIIHKLDPDFKLLVAGAGADYPMVSRAATQSSFIIPLGPLFGEAKAVALKNADIIAMPGAVGLVAVDSFAAQVPIVTTKWDYHGPEFEYLVSGENSIITANDVTSFAEGVLGVLNDQSLLELLRANCSVAKNKYTLESMVDNFLDGLLEILNYKRTSPLVQQNPSNCSGSNDKLSQNSTSL